MGFQAAYKRNQVEKAILATMGGDHREAGAPDLRVRMKRLLDADRLLGRDAKSRDHERATYAFYSGEAPGSGVEVWFSSYEAFALQIALRLLGHGWPQGTVVRLMREVRRKLEAEYRRIVEQESSVLFDEAKVRKQAAPGRIVTGNTDAVFLAIASREPADRPDRRPYAFAIRRGQEELMTFILKELPVGTATTSLELVTSAHQLAQHLAGTQPSRRGRKGEAHPMSSRRSNETHTRAFSHRPSPQIEMRAPGALKPNPRNARRRTKREVERIAESIKSAGNLQPIVIDEHDVILAGHGRLAAAKLLGLELVPTIKAMGLTDAQKRLFAIADNKLAQNAGWARDVLATEFAELAALLEKEGLDLTLTGFDPAEIDAILNDFETDFPAADDAPPNLQTAAVSQPGDLWLLGPHRLTCGDARCAADVERLMAGAKARMAFADPPYNLRIASFQGRGRTKHREFLVASGEQTREEFIGFLKETSTNIAAACMDGAIVFMCMDWRHCGEMLAAGEEVFSELKNLIVWNKGSPGQGSFYRSQHELIFAWKVGDGKHINAFGLSVHGRMRANVWTYPGANSFKSGRQQDLALHPTVKPVLLVADALRDCSMKGDIVVDLFIGSGTTIMAAEKVGRCAYGMELDPLYVDVAIRRWKAATKADVVLAADGRTFEEITAARLAEGGAASPPPRPPALRTEPEGAEDWVALAEGRFASMDGTQT